MDNITYDDSIVIAAPPEALYAMVADVTRMGEFSPVCKACWWDEGQGPEVGSWFTGRNENDGNTWETRSQVVAADPGQEFAFMVGGTWIRWGYTFTPVAGGTEVTEAWDFTPVGIALFHEWFGDTAEAEIASRVEAAHTGIPATLAALKKAAEAG